MRCDSPMILSLIYVFTDEKTRAINGIRIGADLFGRGYAAVSLSEPVVFHADRVERHLMRVRAFGGMELTSATAEPVRLPTRRTALLLVALILAGPKGARRAALSEAFWADRGDAQSRGSLRQALAG